jgi:hypothetical protein
MLQNANMVRSENRATPIQMSIYCRSKLEYLIARLEEALAEGNASAAVKYRYEAAKTCRKLVKTTRKAAQHRTEAFRMKGLYFYIIGKQERAIKWLGKAVREGERLSANLELSRTYYEIGKRLMESGGRYKSVNGINANGYLKKAKTLFQTMNLRWDLDKLDRLTAPED